MMIMPEKLESLSNVAGGDDWRIELATDVADAMFRFKHRKQPRPIEVPCAFRVLNTKVDKLLPCKDPQMVAMFARGDLKEFVELVIDDLRGGGLNPQEIRHLLLKGL